jgi:hypothetical protein
MSSLGDALNFTSKDILSLSLNQGIFRLKRPKSCSTPISNILLIECFGCRKYREFCYLHSFKLETALRQS